MGIERHTLLTESQAGRTAQALIALFQPAEDLPGALLAALAGASLHAVRHSAVSAVDLSAQVEAICTVIAAAPDVDSLGLDPLILAALAQSLFVSGIPFGTLEGVVTRLARELAGQPARIRESGRIRLLSSLLATAGRDVEVAPPPKTMAAKPLSAEALLAAGDDELLEIADHVCAGGVTLDDDAATVLGTLMLTLLRDYRIDLSSRVLRSMLLQRLDPDTAEEGLRFIVVQRGSDGLYGYSDPFSDRFANAAARNREFRLPMTTNALWLFATALSAER